MIPFPNKKYKIIYADPPWPYFFGDNTKKPNIFHGNTLGRTNMRVRKSKFRITPYQGMKIEEIQELPINSISDENCVLLVWITFPALEMGLETVKKWGFNYITVAFTWIKKNKSGYGYFSGLGNYTKANAEICLLAKKGRGCPVIDKTIKQVCVTPLSEHSKKPDEVRQKIVKLFGDLPRIELFARTKIHGWDTWGNDPKLQAQPLEAFL